MSEQAIKKVKLNTSFGPIFFKTTAYTQLTMSITIITFQTGISQMKMNFSPLPKCNNFLPIVCMSRNGSKSGHQKKVPYVEDR